MVLSSVGNSLHFYYSSVCHRLFLLLLSTGTDASAPLVRLYLHYSIIMHCIVLFLAVELLSKVVRSHSNGNYTEYQMHAAFELQNKPGTLLQVLTILTVS